ncbi:hypothetical protein PINS_up008751 [Pythium insidiosum]|nr:hypothetical protein PINS_up008751 [Pythium insidiosum]
MSSSTSSSSAAPAAAPAPSLVAPHVARLDAAELGALLEAPNASTKLLVVDVRDPGTEGGFIKGAINVPKARFDEDAFVDEFLDKHAPRGTLLVFHCLNSNGRGPTAAGRVHDRINAKYEGDDKPQVRVLKGGFRVFSETYGLDSPLIDPTDLH